MGLWRKLFPTWKQVGYGTFIIEIESASASFDGKTIEVGAVLYENSNGRRKVKVLTSKRFRKEFTKIISHELVDWIKGGKLPPHIDKVLRNDF